MAIGFRQVVQTSVLFGIAGIGVAVLLLCVSSCCIDQAIPGFTVTAYNFAFKWLWLTSILLPDYLVGPLDRSALLLRVIGAVAMNGVPYAAIGAGLGVIRATLIAPKR
jgi:hypothetical protein